MTFDLRGLIREELESSPVADPHIVSEHVLKRIRDDHADDVWAALAQCLYPVVREVATSGRFRPPTPHEPRVTKSAPSAKCNAQRLYRKIVGSRFDTGPDRWKWFGECTRDDVLYGATYRRDLAAKNLARAEQLEAVAEKMRVYRAETVADLDAALLLEIFG